MKNDIIYLKHILEEIAKVGSSLNKISKTNFKNNVDLQDANIRRLEVIGEATKNISLKLKNSYPDVEWKLIAGTRDILIHAYFSVDLDLVWGIIKNDLPKFKKMIEKILKNN